MSIRKPRTPGRQLIGDADLLVGELAARGRGRHRVVRRGQHDLVERAIAQRRVAVAALPLSRLRAGREQREGEQREEADARGSLGVARPRPASPPITAPSTRLAALRR